MMDRLFFLLEHKQRFGSRLTTQRGLFLEIVLGRGVKRGRERDGVCVIATKGRSSVHDDCDAIPYTYQDVILSRIRSESHGDIWFAVVPCAWTLGRSLPLSSHSLTISMVMPASEPLLFAAALTSLLSRFSQPQLRHQVADDGCLLGQATILLIDSKIDRGHHRMEATASVSAVVLSCERGAGRPAALAADADRL